MDTNSRSPILSLIVSVWEGTCNSNNSITLVNLDHPVVLPGRVMRDVMILYMSFQNRVVQDPLIHDQIQLIRMFLQSVSTNINCRKRMEATANHLPAKRIRYDMGPSLLLIHSCKKSLMP